MNQVSIRRISVVASTALTLVINYLAITIPLNGKTTQQLSDHYPVFVTPASYVFMIWTVIYIGLISFAFYQFVSNNHEEIFLKNTSAWYAISCLANALWIVLWHYEYVSASLAVMIILLFSLIMLYKRIADFVPSKEDENKYNLLYKLPVSIYLGWISVATIVNVAVVLHANKFDGFGFGGAWGALLIFVAVGLAIGMLRRFNDYAYVLVVLWAIVGIGLKFSNIWIISMATVMAVITLAGAMVLKTKWR